MATPHTCHIDCELIIEGTRKIHMMHAAEPSSAAGRYQWEQNAKILAQGRRAWRATGQGQSRACRVWDYLRRTDAPRPRVRAPRRFMAMVGSPWSDEHTLRTFNARVREMAEEAAVI